jgi:hypothetical protein
VICTFGMGRTCKKLLSIVLLSAVAFCLQGCGTTVRLGSVSGRSEIFNVRFEDAKAAVHRMRPSNRWGRELGMRGEESASGSYIFHIREGGSAPGGRWTTIEISKVTENSSSVHLSSWTDNILFPSHKAWHTERKRWQELKGKLLFLNAGRNLPLVRLE